MTLCSFDWSLPTPLAWTRTVVWWKGFPRRTSSLGALRVGWFMEYVTFPCPIDEIKLSDCAASDPMHTKNRAALQWKILSNELALIVYLAYFRMKFQVIWRETRYRMFSLTRVRDWAIIMYVTKIHSGKVNDRCIFTCEFLWNLKWSVEGQVNKWWANSKGCKIIWLHFICINSVLRNSLRNHFICRQLFFSIELMHWVEF